MTDARKALDRAGQRYRRLDWHDRMARTVLSSCRAAIDENPLWDTKPTDGCDESVFFDVCWCGRRLLHVMAEPGGWGVGPASGLFSVSISMAGTVGTSMTVTDAAENFLGPSGTARALVSVAVTSMGIHAVFSGDAKTEAEEAAG